MEGPKMTDSIWARAAAYSAIAIVAAASWAVAQTTVDTHRATLPLFAYIDCLQKFETSEWTEPSGGIDGPSTQPSGSAVCKDLASRETVD